jgi:hypothetical protein
VGESGRASDTHIPNISPLFTFLRSGDLTSVVIRCPQFISAVAELEVVRTRWQRHLNHAIHEMGTKSALDGFRRTTMSSVAVGTSTLQFSVAE